MANNKYAAYFKLETQMNKAGYNVNRVDLIKQFTNNTKSSLTELERIQYTEFISWIRRTFQVSGNSKEDWKKSPENKMRQKLWVIFCKEMKYSQADYEAWFIKMGKFHRPLKHHTKEQLQVVIPIAEKVLESYTKSINK